MNSPFPVRLRSASIVPRWSIVHTHKPDYIAGHSFYVAIYSAQIARIIEWKGVMGELLWEALTHDVFDELVVGDIVGPVKSNIIDPQRFSNFVAQKVDEMMPGLPRFEFRPESVGKGIKLIVKAADQLDALLYALGEQALGNQIIAARIPSCYDKLREAWFKLPINNTEGFTDYIDQFSIDHNYYPLNEPKRGSVKLVSLWLDVVVPAIGEHRDPAMYDIERP